MKLTVSVKVNCTCFLSSKQAAVNITNYDSGKPSAILKTGYLLKFKGYLLTWIEFCKQDLRSIVTYWIVCLCAKFVKLSVLVS